MQEFYFSMRGLSQNLGKGFLIYVKFVGGVSWTHFVSVHLVVRLAFSIFNFLTFLPHIVLIDHQFIINIIHNSHTHYLYTLWPTFTLLYITIIISLSSPLLIITSYHNYSLYVDNQPCIVRTYMTGIHILAIRITIDHHHPPINIIIILTSHYHHS